MNKRTCLNIEGLVRFESPRIRRFARYKHETTSEAIREVSPQLRFEYCSLKCPREQLCKFYARYGVNWRSI